MGLLAKAKRVLVGRPIATKHAHNERLPKRIALPVFASDALSSTAYATEEIMRVFTAVAAVGGLSFGAAYFGFTLPVSIAIVLLIAIVATSYVQTIFAYPGGGGSYTVSKENLGQFPGEVAGASLLIDYVLTVSVSVSAGVLALVSMAPQLSSAIVPLGVFFVFMLMIANLRGAKESGTLFAVPAYSFIFLLGTMILVGLFFRPAAPVPPEVIAAQQRIPDQWQGISILFVIMCLKAFSSGCTALTGIEAISNGTQAFKEPVSVNASRTLWAMAGILSFLFIGTSALAVKFHIAPIEEIEGGGYKTVVAQICQAVFDPNTVFGQGYFWVLQAMTAGILVLAANTAYADFPRLASLIARDGYLPRQLTTLGDRLVFQNGILLLSAVAAFLIIQFQGDTHRLIPLYAIGVFLGFTLSQFGMVVHSKREGRQFHMIALSAIGGTITAVITVVIAVMKFHDGAWIVPIALGAILLVFTGVKRHYKYLAKELEVHEGESTPVVKTTVIMLVPRLHRGVLQAIGYAKSLAKDVRAVHVTLDKASAQSIKVAWDKFDEDIPLVVLESPYRSLIAPVIDYIDTALAEDPTLTITVIVPEAVPRRWYHRFLHNNVAFSLKRELGSRRNVVITNVRYFLK